MATSKQYAPLSTVSLNTRSVALIRRTAPALKKTIQLYKAQLHRLEAKHDQLLLKRADLNSRNFVILEESTKVNQSDSRPARHTVGVTGKRSVDATPEINFIETSVRVERSVSPVDREPGKLKTSQSQKILVEQGESYQSDVSSLVSTATTILIESLELRLGFIRDILTKLNALYREEPKVPTPPELGYQRYEEWVGSNQRLLELNAQLYDIERLKFELKKKQSLARRVKKSTQGEEAVLAGSLFLKSSVQRIQSFMSRFTFETPLQDRTTTYLQELLNPRGDKTTLEAQKIEEYVRVCVENMDTPIETVIGGHPQAYQQFMAVLSSYIVEKQREVQGEELPYALVHSTIERHLIPKILPAVMRHVSQRERDSVIEKQCARYADITLSQLKVNAKFHSNELVPFFESITQLRASYFSPTATDKMYAVVAAAKALYERLGAMGESSIDGDSFLDLWVYVILKARVKDLATNLYYMTEYGNPMLAMDEAGYYLTSLEAAVTFIEQLEPSQLAMSGIPTDYVVCECSKFQELSLLPSACFKVISHRVELPGYRVGVVRKWVLNKAKLVSSVLISTGDSDDVAIVSVIRFSLDHSSASHTDYFTNVLRQMDQSHDGLSCSPTPLGLAVTADLANINPHNLLILPTGDHDAHHAHLTHLIQLIRLGSEDREDFIQVATPTIKSAETVEDGFLYVQSPALISGHGSRLKSDSVRVAVKQTDPPVDSRRALSFNESTAYTMSPPYLLGLSSQVSLNTLAASSPVREPKNREKQSWFGRRFKSKKEKSERSWHGDDSDQYRGVARQYPDSSGKITSEYPSSSSKYTESGTSRSAVSSTDTSPYHSIQSGRNVQTVEVEVHEPATPPHPLDSVVSGSTRIGFRNAIFDSSAEFGESRVNTKSGPDQRSPNSLDVLHSSLNPSSEQHAVEEVAKDEMKTLGTGDFATLSFSSQTSSTLGEDPFLKVSMHMFSDDYLQFLEGNFQRNHMTVGGRGSSQEAMRSIVKQAQLFLQRLNYLSSCFKIDGVYSDSTLKAVLKFQISHNSLPGVHLLPLPENGFLTAACFQYLRQGFMTIYANMIRIGLDQYLGVNFDPSSTEEREVNLFKDCVHKFQESSNLIGRCQLGVLCSNTVEKIRPILKS